MVNQSLNNSSSFHNPHLTQAAHSSQETKPQLHLTDETKAFLSTLQNLGLRIEICGSWLWVFGATGSHEAQFRAANFQWSHRKGAWYFCPPNHKRRLYRQAWGVDKIRETYGSRALAV